MTHCLHVDFCESNGLGTDEQKCDSLKWRCPTGALYTCWTCIFPCQDAPLKGERRQYRLQCVEAVLAWNLGQVVMCLLYPFAITNTRAYCSIPLQCTGSALFVNVLMKASGNSQSCLGTARIRDGQRGNFGLELAFFFADLLRKLGGPSWSSLCSSRYWGPSWGK